MKTIHSSDAPTSPHPAALLPMLLLALWLLSQTWASAAGINVTVPNLPRINSYVPARAMIGESVLANHTALLNAEAPAITAIEFPKTGGGFVSAPTTRVTDRLIRFRIPAGAITGRAFLVNAAGERREQADFSVVAFALRARGLTLINMAQYQVDSVKSGAQELLTGGTIIPTNEARFVSLTLSATRPVVLDFRYSHVPDVGDAVPVLFEREMVLLPQPLNGSTSALTAIIRTEKTLERLTVADLLGVSDRPSRWKIFQGDRLRTMTLTEDGRVTLQDQIPGGNRFTTVFDFVSSGLGNNADKLSFAISDPTRGIIGEFITVPLPFDAFCTDQLGFFNRIEDDRTVTRSIGNGTAVIRVSAPPILVRRTNG